MKLSPCATNPSPIEMATISQDLENLKKNLCPKSMRFFIKIPKTEN